MRTRWIGICTLIATAGFFLISCNKEKKAPTPQAAPTAEPAPAPKKAPPPPPKPEGLKKYETPEAVFKAAREAAEKKDFDAMFSCFAPDSHKELASGMLIMLGFVSYFEKSMKSEVEALMKKHELPDQKAMQKWKGTNKEKMEKLKEAFKDPKAFVLDAFKLFEKAAEKQKEKKGKKKGQFKSPTQEILYAEVVDLKIDGYQATAKMKNDAGKTKPIEFVKVDDSWFIFPRMK